MKDLNLFFIATRLEALEETIISKLIDRIQFRANLRAYQAGQSGFEGEAQSSLLDIRLLYQERMDSQFGRFCVPEERPFNRALPPPQRKVILPDAGLKLGDFDTVNVTGEILKSYIALVPRMCQEGDDGQYGSSVEHDVYAVQAIARRIHYGALYVAESKYRDAPEEYRRLIKNRDSGKLMALLTRRDVESKIIERVGDKVVSMQANVNTTIRNVMAREVVVDFYRDVIIPLTKQGEVQYLFHRKQT